MNLPLVLSGFALAVAGVSLWRSFRAPPAVKERYRVEAAVLKALLAQARQELLAGRKMPPVSYDDTQHVTGIVQRVTRTLHQNGGVPADIEKLVREML